MAEFDFSWSDTQNVCERVIPARYSIGEVHKDVTIVCSHHGRRSVIFRTWLDRAHLNDNPIIGLSTHDGVFFSDQISRHVALQQLLELENEKVLTRFQAYPSPKDMVNIGVESQSFQRAVLVADFVALSVANDQRHLITLILRSGGDTPVSYYRSSLLHYSFQRKRKRINTGQ